MKLRDFLLKNIHRLPGSLNAYLMKLNQDIDLIYGKKYVEYKEFLKSNQENYDNSKELLRIVNNAIENVPFYGERYRKITDINEFRSQFAFIDKDIIAKKLNSFLSKTMKQKDYMLGTTGGTSGNPLKLYIPVDRYVVEMGTMHALWKRVGFEHNVRAVMRNKKLDESEDFVINPITKEVIFDGFRLNENYFQVIYNTIKKYNIQYIHAYPSSAYELSRFLVSKNLYLPSLKAFLCGSENVNPQHKRFIEDNLNTKFYSWYGHSEKLVLGGYCERSDVYHIEPTYGYFELIDDNGMPVTEPGKVGEIVGTTLHNRGMPLIRYKTDDYAEYAGNYCEYCQRHVPLLQNIQGRWHGSKIYGADGSVTTTTALNFHDDLYMYLDGLQYVQREKGKLEVLVIKGYGFADEHDKRLKDYYKSKFSADTSVSIKYVEQLRRRPNGKFVELMSDIPE